MITLEHNRDGSVTGKLSYEVTVKGEPTNRLTIPAIKGKHLRLCPFTVGSADVKLGQLVDFAALIVEPIGVIDELSPEDALAVAAEVGSSLGPKVATDA